MTEVVTKRCSDCGTPLEGVNYGYEGCGPHALSEFIAKPGYKMPLPACYSTWGGGDDFAIAAEDLPEPTTIWQTEAKCCAFWREPEADDEDFCPKCRDVMEPADETGDDA